MTVSIVQVSDVVVHIFGGPEMVVTAVTPGVAVCEWFADGCQMSHAFPARELVKTSDCEAPRKRYATPRSRGMIAAA
ncbi:MAG: hypothetical protein ACO1Q7_07595 [Gemmatimonas sp.]